MAAITLCFDFGNTRQKYAVFKGADLQEVILLENTGAEAIRQALARFQPERTILSSVMDHDPQVEVELEGGSKFHKLSHLTQLPFTTPVGKPSTIGADRLAIVAAAVNLFPQRNNLAIALGTAITYNFVNRNHEFLGGGISPGMDMRFRSLSDYTAKLPLVKEDWNFPLVGYDTVTNITSGVILGMAKEIDGFIDAYKERYGNFNVLLTGGNSGYFVPHLKNKIFADQNLIFKGLYAISECN